jgi:hypothetical protein
MRIIQACKQTGEKRINLQVINATVYTRTYTEGSKKCTLSLIVNILGTK